MQRTKICFKVECSCITQVRAIDQKTVNGADATIVYDGPESNRVWIEFMGQESNSINYLVQVFGLCTPNMTNQFIFGERQPGDELLLETTVVEPDVSMYRWFFVGSVSPITQVRAIDQRTVNGANATMMSGGPGSNSVELEFKTQPGFGNINYRVYLYGMAN